MESGSRAQRERKGVGSYSWVAFVDCDSAAAHCYTARAKRRTNETKRGEESKPIPNV